jgi:hypothetical protein
MSLETKLTIPLGAITASGYNMKQYVQTPPLSATIKLFNKYVNIPLDSHVSSVQ